MDRRTKILASGFGAVVAFLVLARVVYPTWIVPLLTLDDRVREKSEELAKLEEVQAAVDRARIEYRDYVVRNGSYDFGRVETSVRDRLNELIEKYELENASTAPSRPSVDRKTGLIGSTITVTAVGTLESAVNFMKEVAEMPELVRLGNPRLSPASSGRRGDSTDRINISLPIDLLVLPKNRTVGIVDLETLASVDQFVRHNAQDYSLIWERTPFTPYVELAPLRVDVQRALTVEVGQPGILQATASGGDGNYQFDWNPKEGLTEPTIARTNVDTSTARTQNYIVSVVDGVKDRQPVTATVVVTVREPKPKPEPAPTPTPPPPPPQVVVTPTWPEARNMTIIMTLLRSAGTARTNELMVTNSRTRENTYYKVGDDFDGGKLVYVHQTGGLVRRDKKYFVYPLGLLLAEHIAHEQAGDYPELKSAAERALAMETAQAEAKQKAATEEIVPVEEARHDSRGGPEITAEAAKSIGPEPAAPEPTSNGPVALPDETEEKPQETVGPPIEEPGPDAAADSKTDPASSTEPAAQSGNRVRPQPTQTRPPGPNRPHRKKGNRPGRL